MEKMRLDKYISQLKISTRSQSKMFLKKHNICVNNFRVTDGSFKISPDCDVITLDGNILSYEKYDYIMLYKPKGCVTATKDNKYNTVIDLIGEDIAKRDLLSPVGRLDKDTMGLLLLTDDGELNHRLLSPRHHVKKKYFVTLDAPLDDFEEKQKRCLDGIDIGDEKLTLPALLEKTGNPLCYYITITEGRYHQVKRMFAAFDRKVCELERVSMGTLNLDKNLMPGQYRRLTAIEINNLKKDWS